MIRWCSYCQRFMGEGPPFEELTVTHGICPECKSSNKFNDENTITWAKEINKFYLKLQEQIKTGNFDSASKLFDQGINMGLRPIDLLIGVMQPLLYEVGNKWKQSQITVSDEHRFSILVQDLISIIRTKFPDLNKYRNSNNPKIIITNAENNYHVFAAQIIEIVMSFQKIPNLSLIPSVPLDELLHIVKMKNSKVLAISIADINELNNIISFNEKLKHENVKTKLIVGGFPLKTNESPPFVEGIKFSNDVQELVKEVS